jgi:hypothetical protein
VATAAAVALAQVWIIAAAVVEEATQVTLTFIAVATEQNVILNSNSQLSSDQLNFFILFHVKTFQAKG